MRIIYCLLISALLLQSCKSVDSYNASVTEKKSIESLHKDVDITYKKLQKLHPHLYQYTSKDSLDHAFSNLKQSIKQPLTPQEFYFKLAPVVSLVGQGHLGVYRPYERLEKSKRKSLKGERFDFYGLSYDYVDKGLYVKNVLNYDTLVVGSRILKINEEPVDSLMSAYKKRFSSDGYNSTFYNRFLSQHFARFYSLDKGFQDSIQVTFKKKDSIYSKVFRYLPKDSSYYSLEKKPTDTLQSRKLTKAEKQAAKALAKERRKYNKIHDFNPGQKNYTRNFEFIGKDSTVAYMKLRGFSSGKYKPFYEACFDSIQVRNSQNLIIDLRNNNGGSLKEIAVLYSYLVQEPFKFINEAEVNSRIHTLKALISNGNPMAANIMNSLFIPIFGARDLLMTHKIDGKLYYKIKQSRPEEPNENNFKGNLYVLINGSSFSAASVISTNLQATHRATFVGEETGGAYNGTVAGKYKIVKLPTSKIRLRIGLMQIETPYKAVPDGFGVKPDVNIVLTLGALKTRDDAALEWILKDIEKE